MHNKLTFLRTEGTLKALQYIIRRHFHYIRDICPFGKFSLCCISSTQPQWKTMKDSYQKDQELLLVFMSVFWPSTETWKVYMVNRQKVTTISLFLSLIRRKDTLLSLINFKKGYYLNIFPNKKSSFEKIHIIRNKKCNLKHILKKYFEMYIKLHCAFC